MKKNYWWRVLVVFVGIIVFAVGYAIFYPYKYGLCALSENHCIFSSLKKTFAEPLVLFSLFILVISPFAFFISDKTFLKWLRFALIWIFLFVLFIALIPERHSYLSLEPSREIVSIWMGSLFVIISLIMFVWSWVKKDKVD